MRKTRIVAGLSGAVLLIGASSDPAAAMGPAAPAALSVAGVHNAPVSSVGYLRHRWRQRRYWRWDHRPVWDDPWEVLRPTIWGSPEPHYVPADIWARKWHPAHLHHWHHWARRNDP